MNNTTALNASGRVARTFSVSEFMDFGERYGIDYRFPSWHKGRIYRLAALFCKVKLRR